MKFETVKYWDRIFITPAVSVVLDASFTGYKYITLSFLKWSLDIEWGHLNNLNNKL